MKKWHLVTKKGKNFENLFISLIGRGLAPAKGLKLRLTQIGLSGYLQALGSRYFPYQECRQHISKLQRLLKNQPTVLIKEYRLYQGLLKQMARFADKIPQNNFGRLDLISFLENWSFYFKLAITYGYNYYFLNQPIADIILKSLENSGSQDIFADFEILSQAKEFSVIQKEKLDILKLVRLIKEKKLSLNEKAVKEMVVRHLKRYSFMGLYYLRGQVWRPMDVIKRIKESLKSDWLKEQKRLNQLKRAGQITKRLFRQYKFTDYQKKIVALMKEMVYSINLYDEVHNYYAFKSRPLLLYLARQASATYNQLIEMDFDELTSLLSSNKNASASFKKILTAREKDSVLICQKGKVRILIGQSAKKYIQRNLPESKPSSAKELKGQCACQGQAIGQVVIFKSVADIPKVKKGNIMVAKATVPSFVPAMEKASGIVTEMGGLLSHAAIVSRELGVPCVVGVENAVKILKDGDRVEVDATKGIIKKI